MPHWVAISFKIAGLIKYCTNPNTISQTMVPIILKTRCTIAVLFAFLLAPTEESMAVIQVPIFCPMMMGMAAPFVTCPVAASACRIPTEAELDWIMAVSMAPASTPRMGLWNSTNTCRNAGTSARPETAFVMVSIPNINVENPRRIMPVSFFLLSLPVICRMIPINARIGVKDVGFKSCTKKLSLEMPPRLNIQAVTVVPILAPIITLIACFKVINPEFTNPTTITVVAEEL